MWTTVYSREREKERGREREGEGGREGERERGREKDVVVVSIPGNFKINIKGDYIAPRMK